jgi:hypothetical protein
MTSTARKATAPQKPIDDTQAAANDVTTQVQAYLDYCATKGR